MGCAPPALPMHTHVLLSQHMDSLQKSASHFLIFPRAILHELQPATRTDRAQRWTKAESGLQVCTPGRHKVLNYTQCVVGAEGQRSGKEDTWGQVVGGDRPKGRREWKFILRGYGEQRWSLQLGACTETGTQWSRTHPKKAPVELMQSWLAMSFRACGSLGWARLDSAG